MMSALESCVKTGQERIVDQAGGKPAGEHARPAVGHEGERKTGHRHHAQVHPDVLEDLDDEPAGHADRDEPAEGVARPPVSYTHLRAHETDSYLVCRLL